MSYRYVIFDFDGTLADSLPLLLASLDELGQAHGFLPPSAAEFAALSDAGPAEVLKALAVPWSRLPRLARHYRRLMHAQAGRVDLFPEIRPVLRRLHAEGVRLGLAASNSATNVGLILGDDLELFADGEYEIALLGKAGRLARLQDRSGLAPSELLYVGDEGRDAIAARRAGLAFGAVAWGYATPAALQQQHPEFFFERPSDLLRLLPTDRKESP